MRPRTGIACLAILAAACTSAEPPRGLPAPELGIQHLQGDWVGTFRSLAESGRAGTFIARFHGSDHGADGQAAMIIGPCQAPEPVRDAGRLDQIPRERLQVVRFEPGPEGTLVGLSERYPDPLCGCLVRTVYTGKLRGTVFEGTYVTEHIQGGARSHGHWRLVRRS